MPEVSIIIPHYNNPSGLDRLLYTIPDDPLFEVLVIDDRSNQGLNLYTALKQRNKNSNTVFLTNDSSPKGAGSCRNIGLKHARGKWVLFADSDDFFTNDFFEIISDYLNSDNDAVFFEPTSLDLETKKLSDRHVSYAKLIEQFKNKPSKKHELLLRYKFFVPWSKLIKKELLDSNNIFFEEILASNDVLFSAKVGFFMKKFQVSQETIYCVTKRKGSLTNTYSEDVFEARLGAFINYHKFLHNNLNSLDLKFVDFTGLPLLLNSLLNGYGIKKTYKYFCIIRKSTLKVINGKVLNPATAIVKINKQLKKHFDR